MGDVYFTEKSQYFVGEVSKYGIPLSPTAYVLLCATILTTGAFPPCAPSRDDSARFARERTILCLGI